MIRLLVLVLFILALIAPPAVIAQPGSVECSTPRQGLNPLRTSLPGFIPIGAVTPIGVIDAYYHDPTLRCYGYFVSLNNCGGPAVNVFMSRIEVDSLGWH